MGNFYRVANVLSNYPGLDCSKPEVVALIYALKQWDAAMYMISQGYDGKVEGVEERLQDDYIYKKIARIIVRDKNLTKVWADMVE